MFRLANAKSNLLIEVGVQVLMSMNVKENGNQIRKFYQLGLEREMINMLAMTWTVVHPIDGNSPLQGLAEKDFIESEPEFLVFVNAINDTNSQPIHARTSYKRDEIVWGAKFASIYKTRKKKTIVRIDKISEFTRL